MKNKINSPLIALAVLACSYSALAEETPETTNRSVYAGLLAGATNSASSTVSSGSPSLGVTAGFKLSPNFGLGIMGNYYGQTSSENYLGLPSGTNTKTLLIVAQADAFLGDFHMGLDLGTAIHSWTGSISQVYVGSSADSVVFGPHAGFDIKLTPSLSLGAEGHYLFSNAKNGANNLLALAVFKAWL